MLPTFPGTFVPFTITVCGIDELSGYCEVGVSHVLSILDPDYPESLVFKMEGAEIPAPINAVGMAALAVSIAAIFYLGVRQFIYGMPVPDDLDADLALRVRAFLRGMPAAVGDLIHQEGVGQARRAG